MSEAGGGASDDATRFAGSDVTRIAGSAPGAPAGGDVPSQLGPYRILRRVGGGGMGHIYLAEQTTLRRQVALKVLPPGFLEGSEAHERFQREVQVLGQLSHPNICPVLETGRDGDTFYYAMEYLRGLDVAKVLRTQRMEPRRAVEIAVQVLRALQFAHDKGVVHRDLKPHNIMLMRGEKARPRSVALPPGAAAESRVADPHLPSPEWQDHAVLIDFGLARDGTQRTTKLTITGAVVGTPAYMSPEQARGESSGASAASDVYSMGAVLYEMLALRPPFEGETVAKLIHDVIETEPRPLRAVNPQLDRDIGTIVAKALEKDPARRFATAAAFADDLERWLAGEPIQARPAGLAYRVGKKISRNRLASAAIAVAAVAAGVGLWMAFAPGRLTVRTTPSGAEVLVDGTFVGRTPVSGRWIPGQRKLEIRLREYETEVDVPVVDSGGETVIERTLRHETGLLSLTSEPTEAGLELRRESDGKIVRLAAPATDQPVETGTWQVRAAARNHAPREFVLTVTPGGRHRRHITLTSLETWSQWAGGPNQSGLARDLDGDGGPDILAVHSGPMRVLALGGERGTLLWTFEIQPLLPTGNVRVDAGDLDGDLADEVVFVDGTERLHVLEGATGRRRAAVALPGARMAWIHDDASGDALPDVFVLGGGLVRMLEGTTLRTLWSAGFEERVGWGCEGRFRAGAPRGVAVRIGQGTVAALDGATGAELWRFAGKLQGAFWADDLDGDGLDDLSITARGEIAALSGADGHELYRRPAPGVEPDAEGAILNLDDDPQPELVRHMGTRFGIFDGRTGMPQGEIPVVPSWGQASGVDLDRDGKLEVVVPSVDSLVAADPRTGRILWTFSADSPIFRHPIVADFDRDGRADVAAFSWSGSVYVLAAEESPVAWKQEAGGWVSGGFQGVGEPAESAVCAGNWIRRVDLVDGGIVAEYAGKSPGYATPFRMDGRWWVLATGEGMARILDAETLAEQRQFACAGTSEATLVDLMGDAVPEALVGASRAGADHLTARDLRTGAELWTVRQPHPAHAGIALCAGTLWVPAPGRVSGLDPRTGAAVAELLLEGTPCSVRALDGAFVLATAEGTLVRARPTGTAPHVEWRTETGLTLPPHSPVVAGSRVYVISEDGTAAVADGDSGKIAWRTDLGEAVEARAAARDLDGDGAAELAVALRGGRVLVLDGRTGRVRWSCVPGGEFGLVTPTWGETDGDGVPELLLATRRPHGYALRVRLQDRPPSVWPSYRTRAEGAARRAGEEERVRQEVLEAERRSDHGRILEIARGRPTAFAAFRGAFAAEAVGDREAARGLIARARAAGVRRLDLEWLAARLAAGEEAVPAFAAALLRARHDEVVSCVPAEPDRLLWARAALDAAGRSLESCDWERAVLLSECAGEPAAAAGAFERALAAQADPGPLHLARARAALRNRRFEFVLRDLEAAGRSGASREGAGDLHRALERVVPGLCAEAAEFRRQGQLRRAAAALAGVAALRPEFPAAQLDLVEALAALPDATPEDRRLAVVHGRRAVDLLDAHSGADRGLRLRALDALSEALFADARPAEAAEVLRSALELPMPDAERLRREGRLAAWEKSGD